MEKRFAEKIDRRERFQDDCAKVIWTVYEEMSSFPTSFPFNVKKLTVDYFNDVVRLIDLTLNYGIFRGHSNPWISSNWGEIRRNLAV